MFTLYVTKTELRLLLFISWMLQYVGRSREDKDSVHLGGTSVSAKIHFSTLSIIFWFYENEKYRDTN